MMSLKQVAQEISYLQAMLSAIQAKRSPFFSPLQAARLVHQLSGMRHALSPDSEGAVLYTHEIENLLEQAYEMIGTVEITA